MKLFDFLVDEKFNNLRRAIGAPLSNFNLKITLPKPLIVERNPVKLPAPVYAIPTEGLEVDQAEINVHFDGTLTYKNKRVLVHIRDATHHEPRFHLANCITLIEMKHAGRFEKYVVSHTNTGQFYVRMGTGPLTSKSLKVCQNCLDKISWMNFSRDTMHKSERHRIVDNFSIRDFFSKYPISLHPEIPKKTSESAPLNEYPANWSEIASSLKQQLGYYCQACNIVVGESNKKYLHVHHLNGLKNDCRLENLKCLCISCHSNEHQHANLKNTSDYSEFVRLFKVLN